jgi:TolB-like protein
MATAESEVQAARNELERVLGSPGFTRNERLARFLRFVVERHLEGKDEEIKESVIAVEVFGRSADHDPKQSSIVRTEASRLRARLNEYYLGEGKDDPVVIELPKGRYVPVLHQVAVGEEAADPSPRTTHPLQSTWPIPGTWLIAGIACVLLAGGASVWWLLQHQNKPISIAVLPLVNLSREPNSDYFADGLTGEIIRDLSLIDGLVVRSQTSSFAFKGKPRNVRDAGKQLNADYVLEGSVLRAGEQLRMNAQLVRVRDDFPVWSGRYDRELTDVFAIQDEISQGIVNSLRLSLGRGRRRYETSTEAYDLYLRARALPIQTGIIGYDGSIPTLEAAIAKDPAFAPAWAELAVAHAERSGEFRFNLSAEKAKMHAAAEKAIQMDPLLAEAHEALAMAYAREARWRESEKSFQRAIELDSNSSEPRMHLTLFLLWPLGRMGEAIKQLRIAEGSDPLSVPVHIGLFNILIAGGHYDTAEIECEKIPEGSIRSECLGRVRLGQGRAREAIEILTVALNRGVAAGNEVRGYLGFAYGKAGRREDAEKLEAETPSVNPFNHAVIFAGLGDKDRTFESLDRATSGGPFRMGRALLYPELSLLRGDPRVKVIRRKVGLPE